MTRSGQGKSWAGSLVASAVATGLAMGLMFWARAVFQIRTLPERIMEWVLLFVPLEAFEKGLQQFGPKAKEIALNAGVGIMALVLIAIGAVALRRARSGWTLLAVGLGLFLFAMLVVMPVTGAGLFGGELFQNVWLVNASYLAVALLYATALMVAYSGGREAAGGRPSAEATTVRLSLSDLRPQAAHTRRPLLAGVAGLAASFVGMAWFGREGASATSSLPLAQVKPQPTAAVAPTRPAPAVAAGQQGAPSPPPAPTAPAGVAPGQPAVAPAPPPTVAAKPAVPPAAEGLPMPPPPRSLSRDKDGSLTAAARKPGELAALITPNDGFYVVTKNAAGDPLIKPDGWRLIVDGEVNTPVQLDYRTLRQLPAVELVKTLECISNFTAMCELTSFGCELISTATWRGARLVDVLELAGGLKRSAVGLAVLSTDEFSSAIPLEAARDPDTILAYEMNGEVLPHEHGYPARLLAPGRYGMKNAKWVMAIRPMSREFADWYGQRNWNREGIVKTMSRIDLPAPGAELAPGQQRIAGVAYAGTRGIKRVEFSVDGGGSWQPAELVEEQAGRDAWVRWQGTFEAAAGASVRLVARATDGTGAVQTETFSLPQPDGGSGRHSIEVKVRTA